MPRLSNMRSDNRKLRRARTLLPSAPRTFTLQETGVSVVVGAAGANPGVISTGTVARGSAIADRSDMVFRALPGSTVPVGSSNRLDRDALVYNHKNLLPYDLTPYGTAGFASTIQYVRTPSYVLGAPFVFNSSIQIGVTTDATVIGVLAFTRNFANRADNGNTNVQIMQILDDGSQVLFNTLPAISFPSSPAIIYYQMPAGLKRLIVIVSDNFGGLVLPESAQFYPFNFADSAPTLGSATDSFGVRLYTYYPRSGRDGLMEEVSRLIGAYGHTQLCWSGGGYGGFSVQSGSVSTQTLKLQALTDAKPDITLLTIGINDGFSATEADAAHQLFLSYVRSVLGYIRNQNPGTVLVMHGGSQKASSDAVNPVFYRKKDALFNLLSTYAGPWVFVDNYDNKWFNSRGQSASITEGTLPWITGEGALFNKSTVGVGNSFDYNQDSTHPGSWYGFTTSASAASGATSITLNSGLLRSDGSTRAPWNLIPRAGTVSIQPSGSPVNYAGGQTRDYTMAPGSPNVMTLSSGLSAGIAVGANVFPVNTVCGVDYIARQLALAIIAGVRSL